MDNIIDKYLLSEVSIKISPYLNSMFARTNKITKEEAAGVAKELSMIGDKLSYTVSMSVKGNDPMIVVKGGDAKIIGKAIAKAGFKVKSSMKIDGSDAFIIGK